MLNKNTEKHKIDLKIYFLDRFCFFKSIRIQSDAGIKNNAGIKKQRIKFE